jgi:hypothetical protein
LIFATGELRKIWKGMEVLSIENTENIMDFGLGPERMGMKGITPSI